MIMFLSGINRIIFSGFNINQKGDTVMSFKKFSLLFTLLIFILTAGYAQDAYNQYVKIYGKGVVIASDKALPPRNQVDTSLVEFKNGVSYIKGGPGATFNIRTFTQNGQTHGEDLNALLKGLEADKIIKGTERLVLRIWTSHDTDGHSNMQNSSWPKKLADSPGWQPFSTMRYFPEGAANVNNNGYDWSDLNMTDSDGYTGGSLKDWIANAKPGYKMYIQVCNSVIINYKWDAFKQEWETLVYYHKPCSAGTVEIK